MHVHVVLLRNTGTMHSVLVHSCGYSLLPTATVLLGLACKLFCSMQTLSLPLIFLVHSAEGLAPMVFIIIILLCACAILYEYNVIE